MSHTTQFTPPRGWAKAVLIHDGYGMPGTVELRAWYQRDDRSAERDADIVTLLHEDGRVEEKMSASAPEPQQSMWRERELLYRAGMVIGAARLEVKVNDVLEGHEP